MEDSFLIADNILLYAVLSNQSKVQVQPENRLCEEFFRIQYWIRRHELLPVSGVMCGNKRCTALISNILNAGNEVNTKLKLFYGSFRISNAESIIG